MIVTSKFITEIIKTDGNTFSLKTSIPFKEASCSVYVNEKELNQNEFIEIGTNDININTMLEENNIIIIKYEPFNNLPVISHSINSISYFKTYSSSEKLKINQKYELSLNIKDIKINQNFISKCTPFYSSIKKIQEDIGELSETINIEKINYFIYTNSREADEIMSENESAALNSTELPSYIKYWVRYKTDIDIVNAVYLSLTGKENLASKKIGPITIEERFRVPDINSMIKRFNDLFLIYDNQLNASFTSNIIFSGSFVKGGTSYPYPINTRNSF